MNPTGANIFAAMYFLFKINKFIKVNRFTDNF